MTTASTLTDGRAVTIRPPSGAADVDRIYQFLIELPTAVRNYLRYDVSKREWFDSRIAQIDEKNHWRIIAEFDGEIVGDATMDREPFGWTRHVAELRAVVSPLFAGLGLRALLLHELARIAKRAGIGRVFTEVLAQQEYLISELATIGFEREAVRHKYARDLKDRFHDVVVMSADLEAVWEQLQEMVHETDFRIDRTLSGM